MSYTESHTVQLSLVVDSFLASPVDSLVWRGELKYPCSAKVLGYGTMVTVGDGTEYSSFGTDSMRCYGWWY